MKNYFKYPINIVAFSLLMVAITWPIVQVSCDAFAYISGRHHGFQEPWPTICLVFSYVVPAILLFFLGTFVIYLVKYTKAMKTSK